MKQKSGEKSLIIIHNQVDEYTFDAHNNALLWTWLFENFETVNSRWDEFLDAMKGDFFCLIHTNSDLSYKR